jgi:hypothetical protein
VGFTARHSDKPLDFSYWVDGPGAENIIHRIEVFCAEHLSLIGDTQEDLDRGIHIIAKDYRESKEQIRRLAQPRVLCDPLNECFHRGRTIQRWEYEHEEGFHTRTIGGREVIHLCSDHCASECDAGLNEPDVMGAAKGE